MTAWVALNVAYASDMWQKPDGFLREITIESHPESGFDVLMSAYENGARGERAIEVMRKLAVQSGRVDEFVSVSGSDTSGQFILKHLEADGYEVTKWCSPSLRGDSPGEVQATHGQTLDIIEESIGRRPSLGGNYA